MCWQPQQSQGMNNSRVCKQTASLDQQQHLEGKAQAFSRNNSSLGFLVLTAPPGSKTHLFGFGTSHTRKKEGTGQSHFSPVSSAWLCSSCSIYNVTWLRKTTKLSENTLLKGWPNLKYHEVHCCSKTMSTCGSTLATKFFHMLLVA